MRLQVPGITQFVLVAMVMTISHYRCQLMECRRKLKDVELERARLSAQVLRQEKKETFYTNNMDFWTQLFTVQTDLLHKTHFACKQLQKEVASIQKKLRKMTETKKKLARSAMKYIHRQKIEGVFMRILLILVALPSLVMESSSTTQQVCAITLILGSFLTICDAKGLVLKMLSNHTILSSYASETSELQIFVKKTEARQAWAAPAIMPETETTSESGSSSSSRSKVPLKHFLSDLVMKDVDRYVDQLDSFREVLSQKTQNTHMSVSLEDCIDEEVRCQLREHRRLCISDSGPVPKKLL